jgi:membrane protein
MPSPRSDHMGGAGWLDLLKRVRKEAKQDDVSLLAGGVAFFALLALVPAMAAGVSIYGLFANESTVVRQVRDVLGAAPEEVRNLVVAQLRSIVSSSAGGITLTAIIGILVALWSASSGMSHLLGAINVAYDEDESRGFIRVRGVSLLMTIGAIVFLLIAFTFVAIVPALLAKTGVNAVARVGAGIVRWVILLPAMIVALAVLYRFGPDRDQTRWSWLTPGAVFAAVGWLIASLLFSLYTANFGRFNETYGTLSAIVVLMLWLYLTAYLVILGAELNAELERPAATGRAAADHPSGSMSPPRGSTAVGSV